MHVMNGEQFGGQNEKDVWELFPRDHPGQIVATILERCGQAARTTTISHGNKHTDSVNRNPDLRRHMNQDVERFLNLKNPPSRLTAEQTAWFLGFSPHEIPILIAKGLLKPLGHPAPNGQKFFLAKILEDLRRDEKWFGKASDAIVEHWRYKNGRKGQGTSTGCQPDRRSTDAPQFADVAIEPSNAKLGMS